MQSTVRYIWWHRICTSAACTCWDPHNVENVAAGQLLGLGAIKQRVPTCWKYGFRSCTVCDFKSPIIFPLSHVQMTQCSLSSISASVASADMAPNDQLSWSLLYIYQLNCCPTGSKQNGRTVEAVWKKHNRCNLGFWNMIWLTRNVSSLHLESASPYFARCNGNAGSFASAVQVCELPAVPNDASNMSKRNCNQKRMKNVPNSHHRSVQNSFGLDHICHHVDWEPWWVLHEEGEHEDLTRAQERARESKSVECWTGDSGLDVHSKRQRLPVGWGKSQEKRHGDNVMNKVHVEKTHLINPKGYSDTSHDDPDVMKRTCGRLGAKQIWLASHSRASLCHKKKHGLAYSTTSFRPNNVNSSPSWSQYGLKSIMWMEYLHMDTKTTVDIVKAWQHRGSRKQMWRTLLHQYIPGPEATPTPTTTTSSTITRPEPCQRRNLKLAEDPTPHSILLSGTNTAFRSQATSQKHILCKTASKNGTSKITKYCVWRKSVIFPFLIFRMRFMRDFLQE